MLCKRSTTIKKRYKQPCLRMENGFVEPFSLMRYHETGTLVLFVSCQDLNIIDPGRIAFYIKLGIIFTCSYNNSFDEMSLHVSDLQFKAFIFVQLIQYYHKTGAGRIWIYLNLMSSQLSETGYDLEKTMELALGSLRGAFCLLIVTSEGMYAVRDPLGFRPLCLGRLPEGGWMVASESIAFPICGAEYEREVEAGEIISSVGTSGGQQHSGLYFEIRHNGKPTNPVRWCQKG